MRTALITIVNGRHDHLRRQVQWVARMDPRPLVHVVVSMGDPVVRTVVERHASVPSDVVDLPAAAELPLAGARNAGVARAEELGAEAVVLLDVDCLPEATLIGDYEDALSRTSRELAVISGRVKYLPDGMSERDYSPERVAHLGRDHGARVVPEGTKLEPAAPEMLWSLNIATTVATWKRVGGFDESYVGYGGEDTDFGQRLAAAGGHMYWSGRACAHHQYHPTVTPPVQHARSIARNVNIFREKWGFEPMEGWLEQMRDSGYLRRDTAGWHAVEQPR